MNRLCALFWEIRCDCKDQSIPDITERCALSLGTFLLVGCVTRAAVWLGCTTCERQSCKPCNMWIRTQESIHMPSMQTFLVDSCQGCCHQPGQTLQAVSDQSCKQIARTCTKHLMSFLLRSIAVSSILETGNSYIPGQELCPQIRNISQLSN